MRFTKKDWKTHHGCYFYFEGRLRFTLVTNLQIEQKKNSYRIQLLGYDDQRKDVLIYADHTYSKFEADEIIKRFKERDLDEFFVVPRSGVISQEISIQLKYKISDDEKNKVNVPFNFDQEL